MSNLLLCISLFFSATALAKTDIFLQKKLDQLIVAAEVTQSDALLVSLNNKTILNKIFVKKLKPIPLWSITKSILSLLIGVLWDQKKIQLDDKISIWFPEFKTGEKDKITVRHLLEHTSGLKHETGDGILMSQHSAIDYVKTLPLIISPGQEFSYNNEATNLLVAIIEAISKKSIFQFAKESIFDQLQISEWNWEKDRSGHYYGHTGISLLPMDLFKIGKLVLNAGEWQGHRIVSSTWVKTMLSPSLKKREYGLLWWLVLDRNGAIVGYSAEGWLGQYLLIFPSKDIIAVRMRRGSDRPDEKENKKFGFFALDKLIYDLK